MSMEDDCQFFTPATSDLINEQLMKVFSDRIRQSMKSIAYIRVFLEAMDARLEYLDAGINSQKTGAPLRDTTPG